MLLTHGSLFNLEVCVPQFCGKFCSTFLKISSLTFSVPFVPRMGCYLTLNLLDCWSDFLTCSLRHPVSLLFHSTSWKTSLGFCFLFCQNFYYYFSCFYVSNFQAFSECLIAFLNNVLFLLQEYNTFPYAFENIRYRFANTNFFLLSALSLFLPSSFFFVSVSIFHVTGFPQISGDFWLPAHFEEQGRLEYPLMSKVFCSLQTWIRNVLFDSFRCGMPAVRFFRYFQRFPSRILSSLA